MRYKIYATLLWGCLFCSIGYGQAPNWQVTANNYVYSMSLIATGDESCFSSFSTTDIIGVFDAAGICRGKANLISFSAGHRAIMTVHGNNLMETLTYKVYDASANKVLVSTVSMLEFDPETIAGTISTPETITMCEEEVIEECVSKLELTASITGTTEYTAEDTIISTSVLSVNSIAVSFKAGKAIILKPGFWVKASSNFSGVIEDCTVMGGIQNNESTERAQYISSNFNATNRSPTKNLAVQLHPNPASVNMVVNYHLQQAEVVNFYISDYNGKLLRQFSQQKATNGWNTLKLDTGQLEMGFYLLTIHTQSEAITKKMIIIK